MTTRDDERAVTVEANGSDGKGVSRDGVKAPASLDLPNTNRLVKGAGDYEVRLRIEIHTEHEVGVTAEGLHALTGGRECVPDAECTVIGGRAYVVRIEGPGHVGDSLGMTNEPMKEGKVCRRPDDDGFVEGGRRQKSAVGGKFDAGNGALVRV